MAFQNEFINQLFKLASTQVADEDELYDLSEDMMEAMVEFGSETDDNLNCQDHIEYGIVYNEPGNDVLSTYGLKIRDKKILLSDVMNALEALKLSDLPDEVRNLFPSSLTDAEWDATMRMATMVFLAFEHTVDPDANTDSNDDEDDTEDDENEDTEE